MSALPPDMDPTKQPLRVFKAQLIVSLVLGIAALLTFCFLRYRWPHIYAVRVLRKKDIQMLPNNRFGWIKGLYKVTDQEVLEQSGLDAYVFLGFFRMAIQYFFLCSAISICFIGPIRYYYTGFFDSDGISWGDGGTWVTQGVSNNGDDVSDQNKLKADWVYTVFTYIFTLLAFYLLWKQTESVVSIRQRYLGRQNSIADRTIYLEGLPTEINPNDYDDQNSSSDSLNQAGNSLKFDEIRLKRYIEELGIGTVSKIYITSDWKPLRIMFQKRNRVLRALEVAYSKLVPLKVEVYTSGNLEPSVTSDVQMLSRTAESQDSVKPKKRPILRLGLLGIFGEEVDAIDYYTAELLEINDKITKLRQQQNFEPATSAFVTMDSVASAQMAAQAVLDPHVHRLIARLAPSANDVQWDNLALSKVNRFIRSNIISMIIGISTVTLIFPVIYLSTFINIKTIQKFWPALGDWISQSEAALLIIGLIPPYLYTLLNVSVPYFYRYLSSLQGYRSNSEVELSTLSKNFFYIFFNLFLVFTLAGTATNVWALLGDTTKIAYELANSLKNLSLFYVDLILLQGLGMFPFKLLQVGDVILEIVSKIFYCRTARDYRNLYYVPPVFDFGLYLPQHILIMIIAMIYSVTSTKIVTAGLVYFILGYYTYKYQLLYTMVHPQHSTGQSWPMIFRRVCLGLVLFQITMAGTLALERAYILAGLILPLILATLIFSYSFEKDYLPLSFFIALKALRRSEKNDRNTDTSELTAVTPLLKRKLKKRKSTIDELREENISYTCPYLTDPLNGPMIGFDGDYIQEIQYLPIAPQERVIRRYYHASEWE